MQNLAQASLIKCYSRRLHLLLIILLPTVQLYVLTVLQQVLLDMNHRFPTMAPMLRPPYIPYLLLQDPTHLPSLQFQQLQLKMNSSPLTVYGKKGRFLGMGHLDVFMQLPTGTQIRYIITFSQDFIWQQRLFTCYCQQRDRGFMCHERS